MVRNYNFFELGPIALLPLTDETSSLVWSTTHQQAEDLMEMEESDFVSQINSVFVSIGFLLIGVMQFSFGYVCLTELAIFSPSLQQLFALHLTTLLDSRHTPSLSQSAVSPSS